MSQQKSKSTSKNMKLDQVACLIASLDQKTAGLLLKNFSEKENMSIMEKIAMTNSFDREQINQAQEGFYRELIDKKNDSIGGISKVRTILNGTLPSTKSAKICCEIERKIHHRPFVNVGKANPEHLLTLIKDEYPQTIATIMSFLPASKSSMILSHLSPKKQMDVTQRMCQMHTANPDMVRLIEEQLENKLAVFGQGDMIVEDGIQTAAAMLLESDSPTQKGIMENLEEHDPELVDQIRRNMFTYEDLLLVSDGDLVKLVKNFDNEELAIAMKGSSEAFTEKIFSGMSERAGKMLSDEIEYLPPMRISDVEAARQRLVDQMRRMEDDGDIHINRGKETVI